ncbi:response regulator transcription factor [Clostridium rectalis]|uniref:response regulator transcription factor n=1 Tax=Clostridium rectalis TaxID=2040295 RepID=UPI000F6339C1|nr:response regulator transcription factor [Clostridium rectalis]
MIKILLVEDNIKISENISEYFRKDMNVEAVYNGEEALECLYMFTYDVVILDLMLPEVDGMTVLKYISENLFNTGVIVLTAKEELGDKLKAFNLGANDYLTKPFFLEELRARINAILKSMGKISKPNLIEFKDMYIDMKTKSVYIDKVKLNINERLYSLIQYLMVNKGVLLFKEQIFENVCGYDSDASTEIIEVYVSRLRKALAPFGYDKYLITKRGMGYLLDESIGK